MKAGTENRKKTMIASCLGVVVVAALFYAYQSLYGGPSTPPATSQSATTQPSTSNGNAAANTMANSRNTANNAAAALDRRGNVTTSKGVPVIPGVAAERVATTSASLDPTLDEDAMRRTESLMYYGIGRNIFSASYTPVLADIPVTKISPRQTPPQVVPYVAPPPQTCPPSCPPINLKFFGTATRANGQRQAFLLQGDDVYMASQGDIVARKYKVGIITPTSVQITDLQTNFTQNLPFQQQP